MLEEELKFMMMMMTVKANRAWGKQLEKQDEKSYVPLLLEVSHMLVPGEKALIPYTEATSAAPLLTRRIHVNSSSKDSFCQPAVLLSL